MSEKHTVHCRDGGKVIIDGDSIEIHLPGPITMRRQHWIHYFTPREEVRRTLNYDTHARCVRSMLEEAFAAVPMKVHEEKS